MWKGISDMDLNHYMTLLSGKYHSSKCLSAECRGASCLLPKHLDLNVDWANIGRWLNLTMEYQNSLTRLRFKSFLVALLRNRNALKLCYMFVRLCKVKRSCKLIFVDTQTLGNRHTNTTCQLGFAHPVNIFDFSHWFESNIGDDLSANMAAAAAKALSIIY